MATPIRLSFLSINVRSRGLNQARKRRQVFRWAHNSKADIIFLQETYSSKGVEEIWRSEWGGKIHYSHGSSYSKGVLILFNPKLESTVAEKHGRYLMLEVTFHDSTFLLCNVYAPNDNASQNTFFSNLNNTLAQYTNSITVTNSSTVAEKHGRYLMLEVTFHDSTFLLCNVYAPNDNASQILFFSNLNNTLAQYTNRQIILGGDLNCALTPLDIACERRRISGCRLSPPKTNVCELEPENDFRDVESFVFSLANQITR